MIFFPTVDEDFQYFRSQGYTGSLNDMHYKALGDLNHTGALSDRIHSFLVSEYGSFYESMRNLRNSTASFVALRYGVDAKQPEFVLDFGEEYYRVDGLKTALSDTVTHSRASNATMVDSTGTLVTVGNDVPRVGHHIYNGSAWVNEGILHESEARTNLLLNSGTLSTQSATVAAVDNTLSFTGTGTVTLSGVSTAGPLVGTGTGENNRVSLTFTPTAGTLTLTVSGTVSNAQLEVGSTPSSYIPTAGATVTRAAETLTVPAANMPWPTPVEVTGTELLTNSEFGDGLTGWTDSSSAPSFWSVSGGVATQNTDGAAVARLRQSFTTVVGKVYKVSFVGTLDGYAIGTTSGNSDILPFAARTDGYFVAVGTTTWFNTANNTDGLTFESVTVKEINPLSVSIQMDGRMTYADTDAFSLVQLHWWELDANNRLLKTIDGFGTDTGKPVTTMTALGVTDYTVGDVDHYSPGINVPFNYADRYGSTFLNSALEGNALTANLTPTGLPDLSSADFQVARVLMGTIGGLRVWADDLGDTGIVEASAPSLEPSLSLTFDGSENSGFTVLDWSE